MKIKIKELSYDKVLKIPTDSPKKPIKPSKFFRFLMKFLSKKDLKETNFKLNKINMDKRIGNEPCLYLMNHSSFIDLKIASTILYPYPFNIVCTSDGFVGKNFILRHIGCIPTNKFVTDVKLVKDIDYCLHKLNSSVLLFPEASYSFDGTATPLPESIASLIKFLKVPVIIIKTSGAFLRDPLYNNLQLRKVDVSATMKYLLSPEDISSFSLEKIKLIIDNEFNFDNFKDQQDTHIKVDEPFRADGLNRVLYKCPHCLTEGKMIGKGTSITCLSCNKKYELDEYGKLITDGEAKFDHIPNWYKWEREEVSKEIINGTYKLDVDVDIYILKGTKALYKVGNGHLHHDINGFKLDGCDDKLHFVLPPKATYSLYADYYWYEIGDMICIGDNKMLYYCFPHNNEDIVAKTRLATEEIYKIVRS